MGESFLSQIFLTPHQTVMSEEEEINQIMVMVGVCWWGWSLSLAVMILSAD